MDEERILAKVSQLEKYLDELKEISPANITLYQNSIRNKRAVERLLQISIECVIDD
ncbi:MAG: hypothetical protein ACTSWY_11505 [Promethearchaeota archaeon]